LRNRHYRQPDSGSLADIRPQQTNQGDVPSLQTSMMVANQSVTSMPENISPDQSAA
jgi:hypothetical protein